MDSRLIHGKVEQKRKQDKNVIIIDLWHYLKRIKEAPYENCQKKIESIINDEIINKEKQN